LTTALVLAICSRSNATGVLLHDAAMSAPPGVLADAVDRRPPLDELRLRLGDGRSILLRAAAFDPVGEGEPASLAGNSGDGISGSPYRLIQLREDATPEIRAHLESLGVDLLDYVPNRAYVVRLNGIDAGRLARDPLVRWVGAFHGGYKLAPELLSKRWNQGLLLDFRLFPGENPFLVLDDLLAKDPTILFSAIHGELLTGATLRVFVPEGHVHPFVDAAAEVPAVWSVDPWFLPHVLNDNSVWVIQSYDTTNKTTYSLSATIWNHGITGTGQTPGVSDTGLDDDMCFFRLSNAIGEVTAAQSPALPGIGTIDLTKKVAAYYVLPNATSYDGNTTCGTSPESEHGTHVCGSVVGDNYLTLSTSSTGGHDGGDGMAPNAHIIFQDAGSETTGCLDGLNNDYNLIWKQAYDAGVRVHSNSWGAPTAGVYTGDCQVIDRIIYQRQDLLILFAAGNDGPGATTVGSPGGAKNCVTVGATTNGSTGANAMASFSSRGPMADGRIKPDVSAPGVGIISASGDASHTTNNCATKSLQGTSMATPTTAGGATLLREYFADGYYPTGAKVAANALDPSSALLKATLINGAVDIGNTTQATMFNSFTPDNNQGFGRIQLDNALFFSTPSRDARRTRVWDKWNATGLATGENDSYLLQVAAGQPLKVTLVWSDPEASGLTAVSLVNNLDLEVVDPSSSVYKGNVFSAGQSATGGSADLLNNVEEVFLKTPAAGTWTLRVKGTAVPGQPAEPYSFRQGYALVVTYADCNVALAAPTGLTATNNPPSGISLSWNIVPGASRYQIYRADGNCSAAATAYHYIGQSNTTSYLDALVQGGYSYAYEVRSGDNCTDGASSGCATAAYTGNCTLQPTFAGIASATNDTGTPACDVVVSWSAALSNCPLSPGIKYDIYRSPSPYFTPGAGNLLATNVSITSYRDSTVTPNVTYYYTVRSEDSTAINGGPSNGGNQDKNSIWKNATATSSSSGPGTWSDDGGDTAARLVLEYPWTISNQQNHTAGGTLGYHSANDGLTYPPNTCAAATSPVIVLQPATTPVLSYWVRYNIESQWDGVVVEISTNGGVAWTILNPTPAYPDTLSQTGAPPGNACAFAATQGAFTGPVGNGALSAWTQYSHTLNAYAGMNVTLRWRLSSDSGAEFEGLYLDDISLTFAQVPLSCGADVRIASTAIALDTCSTGGAGNGNGTLESGEDARISVVVSNLGDTTATSVTGTLSTTNPNVSITGATASFPNVPSLGNSTSISPHFQVWVAKGVACGTSIPFTLQISTAQGTFNRSFSRVVGTVSAGSGTALTENFSAGIPATWTVVNGGSGGGTSATWNTANPCARALTAPLVIPVAIIDSDCALAGAVQDEQLITPVVNLSTAITSTLTFDQYFRYNAGETGDVDVKSSKTGGAWTNVKRQTASSPNPESVSVDITAQAAGASDAQIRFHYYNASFEWYWIVDNVKVLYTFNNCSQAVCSGAIPTEAGTGASPLRATKPASGTAVNLTFGVPCHTNDVTVYWGAASSPLSAVNWTSASCGLGRSGAGSFDPGVPASNSFFYFVAVANNGVDAGSYGKDSVPAEIPPASGLGVCNLPRNLTGVCP